MQLANKITIKQIVQEEKAIEKEIYLPYFCFNGKDTYYKVMSEDVVICADNSKTYSRISKSGLWLQRSEIAKCSQITEGEFNQAYHEALMEIGKYVPAPEVPFELVK